MPASNPRFSGYGLGLRKEHYRDFLETAVPVDFVEVISENFMVDGGQPRHILRQIRERHPVALHGVSMSIGSADGLDAGYLRRLKALVDEIEPLFVSDHLSWSRFGGFNSHDLLPVPYTEEALDVVCTHIQVAQDALGRTLLVAGSATVVMGEGSFFDSAMHPSLLEGFQGRGLSVGQARFGAAFGEGPAAAASLHEQEFDGFAALPVANRSHLFAGLQLAEMGQPYESRPWPTGLVP